MGEKHDHQQLKWREPIEKGIGVTVKSQNEPKDKKKEADVRSEAEIRMATRIFVS